MSGCKIVAGDYRKADMEVRMNAITGDIISTWKRLAGERKTVVFASSVEHSRSLAAAFSNAGVTSAHIDGGTKPDIRDAALRDLHDGKIRLLTNCGILTEGWDLPDLGCVVMARPTASQGLWRQMVGRGMRSVSGKTDCINLDHAGNSLRFGMPDWDDEFDLNGADQKAKSTNKKPVRMCMQCYAINRANASKCLECGMVFPINIREIEEREGELIEMSGQELENINRLQRKHWIELRAIQIARGYRDGWCRFTFRDRWKCEPSSGVVAERPVCARCHSTRFVELGGIKCAECNLYFCAAPTWRKAIEKQNA
jgi:superfamily II DNA or RNA helicase